MTACCITISKPFISLTASHSPIVADSLDEHLLAEVTNGLVSGTSEERHQWRVILVWRCPRKVWSFIEPIDGWRSWQTCVTDCFQVGWKPVITKCNKFRGFPVDKQRLSDTAVDGVLLLKNTWVSLLLLSRLSFQIRMKVSNEIFDWWVV